MRCDTNHSVVINEYGTNLFKSKFDPLVKAKIATCYVQNSIWGDQKEGNSLMQMIQEMDKTQLQINQEVDEVCSPSPVRVHKMDHKWSYPVRRKR